ncbi:hypothetical protein Trydic_g17615 [Trypoxylus dichotomus]
MLHLRRFPSQWKQADVVMMVIPNCHSVSAEGTAPPTMRIVGQIKEGFNLREYTGELLLDVAKAFDNVWHQGLLLKMHRAGISKAMVRFVHSYLRERALKAKLEEQRSTGRTAAAGVPRGSAISPLLFSIYTNDISVTANVNLAMYADDVSIFARPRDARIIDRRLYTALNTLQAWYAKWRIAVHPEKSTTVLFSRDGRRKTKHGNPAELTFQRGIIPW